MLSDLIVPEKHRTLTPTGLARSCAAGKRDLGQGFEIEAQRCDGRLIQIELSVTALGAGAADICSTASCAT
jgi:hypothetical protein